MCIGTANFVNKKRTFNLPESFMEEEERQKQFFKVFNKLKEIEDDRTGISNQTSSASFNKTVSSAGN